MAKTTADTASKKSLPGSSQTSNADAITFGLMRRRRESTDVGTAPPVTSHGGTGDSCAAVTHYTVRPACREFYRG